MNEKKQTILTLIVTVMILLIIIISFIIVNFIPMMRYNQSCVQEVAEDYCEQYQCKVERADTAVVKMRSYITGELINPKVLELERCKK